MSTPYNGNAIYQHLFQHPNGLLVGPGPQTWPLVYADKDGAPKAVVVVCDITPGQSIPANPTFLKHTYALAQRMSIPFRMLLFCSHQPPLKFAVIDGPGIPRRYLNPDEWRNEMRGFGIDVRGTSNKAINRASSSPYHEWQRDNLGAIRVVDIDLLRLDGAGCVTHLIELKRSSIPMESWTPFTNDSKNFEVLANVAHLTGTSLELAFNRYNKQTLEDDLSRFKVFQHSGEEFVFSHFEDGPNWLTGALPAPRRVPRP